MARSRGKALVPSRQQVLAQNRNPRTTQRGARVIKVCGETGEVFGDDYEATLVVKVQYNPQLERFVACEWPQGYTIRNVVRL